MIFCLVTVEVNLINLWSLIEGSSKTFQSLMDSKRLGDVIVMSITDLPTGEWKVGVDPLLRIFKPC